MATRLICPIQNYRGQYSSSTALSNAYQTATCGSYAYVSNTSSYWYWNTALGTPAWVNQQIAEADYNTLSAATKAAVPYIVEV